MNSKTVDIYNKLMDRIHTAPLSELLPLALDLALQIHDAGFEKWAHLEYEGYFNTNKYLTDDVMLPEYRTVVGNYYDTYGRLINFQSTDLSFANEYRLRHGVSELENMIKTNDFLSIQDPSFLNIINNNLHVNAFSYRFSSTCIQGVLASIRAKLIEYLNGIKITYSLKINSLIRTKSKWTRDQKIAIFSGISVLAIGIITIMLTIFFHLK